MSPFVTLDGIAAPLPIANIDTDRILPGKFLTTVTRKGLGSALFHGLRARPDFVLNRAPWDAASILVTLENFGCGSSREHAPWALLDFGIRCVIAPSIADIFYGNCLRNGILPVRLPTDAVERLMRAAADPATARFRIDLPGQTVVAPKSDPIAFEIGRDAKAALLSGRDEIAASQLHLPKLELFERRRRAAEPWRRAVPAPRFDDGNNASMKVATR